jgi:hypothetical protein
VPSEIIQIFPSGKVTSLHYAASTQQLFSAGEDGLVAIWDMEVKRSEVRSKLFKDFHSTLILEIFADTDLGRERYLPAV